MKNLKIYALFALLLMTGGVKAQQWKEFQTEYE